MQPRRVEKISLNCMTGNGHTVLDCQVWLVLLAAEVFELGANCSAMCCVWCKFLAFGAADKLTAYLLVTKYGKYHTLHNNLAKFAHQFFVFPGNF